MRRILAGLAVLVWIAGCNSGNPVVSSSPTDPTPPSSGIAITVTVVPSDLLAGSSEAATVTVTARRQDNQQSPADGTEVTVSTDQGSLGLNNPAQPVHLTQLRLAAGQAQVSFFPGATVATANILAQIGSSVGQTRANIVDALPNQFYLTAVQPNLGNTLGGDQVTIRGAGFKTPLRVSFGGVAARVVSVPSSAAIVVETPPAATPPPAGTPLPVDVVVTNALTEPQPPMDTLAGGFIYRDDAPPAPDPVFITAVDPRTGSAAGGETVVVKGGGFREPLRVEFGGKVAQVVSVSNARISVVTPSSPSQVPAGATLLVDVHVVSSLNANPPLEANLPGGFTFDGGPAPQPVVVSSLNPAQGPAAGGTEVTVTGQGFVSPVAVTLGGVRQRSEVVDSATQLRFTTAGITLPQCPAGGTSPVMGLTVTNLASGASGTAQLTFTYQVPLPRIRRISPTQGGQLGNTLVSIEGDGFATPVRVVFAKGTQSFAGVVQGTPSATLTRVSSPAVPDSLFPEVDCVTGDNMAGKRFVPITVDIQLTNQGSGCTDTFPNAFTYNPTFPGCRVVTPAP
ncbi:MAG TPA: IPT/TIG domain-containing protein [Thermoanaerobaculia bacterium]|nr:IPT/TIG domain-containing protein [Thermoanaerobaculia bacterium]